MNSFETRAATAAGERGPHNSETVANGNNKDLSKYSINAISMDSMLSATSRTMLSPVS